MSIENKIGLHKNRKQQQKYLSIFTNVAAACRYTSQNIKITKNYFKYFSYRSEMHNNSNILIKNLKNNILPKI